MEYKIPIPHCYYWMTKDAKDRLRLFKRYVAGYIDKSHPDLRLKAIKGHYAICEKK